MSILNTARQALGLDHITQKSTGYYLWVEATLNSYSQIFFSKNRAFAVLILLASFLDYEIGALGLAGVLFTNLLAFWLGFDRKSLFDGLFGINSLFVCLALAAGYTFNLQFLLVFVVACLLTLILNVAIMGLFGRLGLPFLSLPFLLSFWIILLAIRQYEALELSAGNIYRLNELYELGGSDLLNLYYQVASIHIPEIIEAYLQSLGAIILHYNPLTGLLIAIGLFLTSRIYFSLSVLGFIMGYGYYYFVQGDITQIHYSYIGFNFILTAVSLGYFFVASRNIYLLVVVVTPLIAVLIATISSLLAPFQLPVFSAPFAILLMVLLYAMNFSTNSTRFLKVIAQERSPEKNLYNYHNNRERFLRNTSFHIGLPYFGEWVITQGHNGAITHKGDWAYAWDFEVEGSNGRRFRDLGAEPEEYFCYNLPVLAPAAGYIVAIEDDIEDNQIGEANYEKNWGNTIIIKHGEYLYSKLSHLKAGSFEVKLGDYVKKGDVLASLGNSGRSPVPHLHFQLQATPYVGSRTLWHPLAYYISRDRQGHPSFHSFEVPQEQQTISNVSINPLLRDSFTFIPGQRLNIAYQDNGKEKETQWEVMVDAYSKVYIYCHQTKALAYVVNDGTLSYFTAFYGSKRSLLYYFYLAAHKVLLGYYQGLELNDQIAPDDLQGGWRMYLQDIISPFYLYQQVGYHLRYDGADDDMLTHSMDLSSRVEKKAFGRVVGAMDFKLQLNEEGISELHITGKRTSITAKFEKDNEEPTL